MMPLTFPPPRGMFLRLAPVLAGLLTVARLAAAPAAYADWSHHGTMAVLTTQEGANLPAEAVVEGFPLLVRLHREWFDFTQAASGGNDIRFSSRDGTPLAYQVEEWNPAGGQAAIWVRIPKIEGNALQEIAIHWGKADAASESNGNAVFNESNGYLSVWHMGDPARDETGLLESKDTGTTSTPGVIGGARHFPGGKGIFGGDRIPGYPAGPAPHTTEAWFRPARPNANLIGWGNEQAQGKVVMQFRSPPHINMDCYFSAAGVSSDGRLALDEWVHVVHTYENGTARLYVNGVPDGVSKNAGPPLALKSPARLWIGGWYDRYDFEGDMDEVRVSKVARSPEWVRLEYENQKRLQTLVGPVIQPGSTLSVSPATATVMEGSTTTFTASAGGAQKFSWELRRDGVEEILSTGRLTCDFKAGRVTGDKQATLVFKGVYPEAVKTVGIPLTIKEHIPEPVFTLQAPASWDGRSPLTLRPEVTNRAAMEARGAGNLKIDWTIGGLAVVREITPEGLLLKRAQNSGTLKVTATISNGGPPSTQTVTLAVTEPKSDPWVARIPDKDEKPEEGQFYPRNDRNEGTLFYNGILDKPADRVFLKLYADGKLSATHSAVPSVDGRYALSATLKPGLIRYSVEFGTVTGDKETVGQTVKDLVCGDAYLIDGQSNALATDTGEKSPTETHEWIRSYGRPPGHGETMGNLWCRPVWKAGKGDNAELGWWGMELAKRLVESQKIPVCIINGAVGGTRIDQHQRNDVDPEDLATLYGRTLWRVRHAGLTHGIRAVLWHQGENNQGSDGPSGDFDWKSYQELFIQMAAGWQQDFPNVRHYYVFQIWPNACAMGGKSGGGDMIREIQRTLPGLYSNLSVMSTLGITPPGGCHFPLAGWGEFARLIQPLMERDFYGRTFTESITPPDLVRARLSIPDATITLEFDQPVAWADKPAGQFIEMTGQFYLNGLRRKMTSFIKGNVLTLYLENSNIAEQAKRLTYIKESDWSQGSLLRGTNGIAALSFCDVPLIRDEPGH